MRGPQLSQGFKLFIVTSLTVSLIHGGFSPSLSFSLCVSLMAQTPFSLLLLLRRRRFPYLIRTTTYSPFLSHYLTTKPFSTSPSPSPLQPNPNPSSDPKTLTLSARMSFVFDQIDAIEKDRTSKDQTLQRIRAWRESKNKTTKDDTLGLGFNENVDSNSAELEVKVKEKEKEREREGLLTKEVELVHPWPEWIELMERLVQQNYFDHRRKDEDKMVCDLGFDMSEIADEGFDFTRDWKTVQTACLNFGRDRFDIMRFVVRWWC